MGDDDEGGGVEVKHDEVVEVKEEGVVAPDGTAGGKELEVAPGEFWSWVDDRSSLTAGSFGCLQSHR